MTSVLQRHISEIIIIIMYKSVLFVYVFISVFCISKGQQEVTVPVKVNGNPFNVTFAPDLVKSTEIARELCLKNAALLKIEDNQMDLCQNPVSQYFQSYIDEYNSQLSLKVKHFNYCCQV